MSQARQWEGTRPLHTLIPIFGGRDEVAPVDLSTFGPKVGQVTARTADGTVARRRARQTKKPTLAVARWRERS